MSATELDGLLGQVAVGEVWGVGRKLAPKLNALGIHTVLDFKTSQPRNACANSLV